MGETEVDKPAEKDWKLKKVLQRVGLFLALMLYTIAGGIVFCSIEYPSEVSRLADLDAQVRRHRNQFLQTLSGLYNTSQPKTNFTSLMEELNKYEVTVGDAVQGGITVPLQDITAPAELARWNHIRAIFFASTVLTTIGYGDIVPETVAGRSFCLLFAMVGIPLALTVIADIGCLLAASLPKLPHWMPSLPSGTLKSLISACAALLLLLVYLSIGALIFMILEDEWDFFESFYFCFITMTTIGFGDQVPKKPQYMLLCTLYILVGLSLTSTIIEIVRLEYAKSWKRLQALAEALRKLGEAGGSGADLAAVQKDLKNVLNMISSKRKGSQEWESTMTNLIQNINKPKSQQKIIQIVIYETSV